MLGIATPVIGRNGTVFSADPRAGGVSTRVGSAGLMAISSVEAQCATGCAARLEPPILGVAVVVPTIGSGTRTAPAEGESLAARVSAVAADGIPTEAATSEAASIQASGGPQVSMTRPPRLTAMSTLPIRVKPIRFRAMTSQGSASCVLVLPPSMQSGLNAPLAEPTQIEPNPAQQQEQSEHGERQVGLARGGQLRHIQLP